MSEPEVLTFVHRFSRSVACAMRVVDRPPARGHMLSISHEWTGRPKRKHLSAYRQWTIYTTQLLADRWGKRIAYALAVSRTCTEFWCFEPGKPPTLAKKLPFGIG
jgi:hypothetical protein